MSAKVSVNCTSSPSFPAARLNWMLNRRPVDRWMLTSFLPHTDPATGLESSTLQLSFLVLTDHFRGPERELWATCKASMPSIMGVEIPIERTLLLGSLSEGGSYQGGWAASDSSELTRGLATLVLLFWTCCHCCHPGPTRTLF